MKIDVYIDPLDVMTPLSYSQLTECKGGTFLKKKYFVDQLSVGWNILWQNVCQPSIHLPNVSMTCVFGQKDVRSLNFFKFQLAETLKDNILHFLQASLNENWCVHRPFWVWWDPWVYSQLTKCEACTFVDQVSWLKCLLMKCLSAKHLSAECLSDICIWTKRWETLKNCKYANRQKNLKQTIS